MFEVIQKHKLQADWKPGIETASLYKIVEAEHAGTLDDPIPYVQGMAFEKDKYYEQYGVIYLCILTTVTGYPNDLKDLTHNRTGGKAMRQYVLLKYGGGKSPHYKYVTASDFDKEGGRI